MPPVSPNYRDYQRPALIDARIPDSGAASAAQALADTFKNFERAAGSALGSLRAQQGQREGAEAGRSDDPNFRKGLGSLTAYGRAYNDAALRSYAIKSEIAADETATRLELEAGTDPALFQKTFGAVRDATLREAPEEARAILGEVYDRRLAAGAQRIITAQAAQIKARDRADLAEGIARVTDRIAMLRASNDEADAAMADEEEIKLELLIQGAQNDGTYSEVEAGTARTGASRAITGQMVLARFKDELDNPYGDPIGFINRLREANAKSEALAPEEEEKLMGAVLGELQTRSALESRARTLANAEQQARFDAGNQAATSLLFGGKLSTAKLQAMVDSGDLDPNRATTLHNELTNPASTPKSDPETLFDFEVNLLSYREDEIAEAQGLTYADRGNLILKHREWASGWRRTQEGKEAADRIDRALGIPPGMEGRLLSGPEKTKRERALTAWYNAVDAMPEAERQRGAIPQAEEVILKVIKDTSFQKLEKMRERRASIAREYAQQGELSKNEQKRRDEDMAAIDAQITKLEQQVK